MSHSRKKRGPGLSRRDFLRNTGLVGTAVAMPWLPACGGSKGGRDYLPTESDGSTDSRAVAYNHGVASGDPLTDRVILWTRVTPAQGGSLSVDWLVATDQQLTNIVAKGTAITTESVDYTVKVDPTGLQPGTTYYYRFSCNGFKSPIGRTKTAAVGSPDRLRFAVVSCASYPHGFFNAYKRIAERPDLDAVIHLGDYIYEYGNQQGQYGANVQAGGRKYAPEHEMLSLEDYRTRYGHYRLDPDLQELHRQYAFINVWDDHESTNDSWEGGADNHNDGEGDWFARKAISIQTFYEWLPIREIEVGNPARIYRRFTYGDLVDLLMLDTRLLARSEQLPATVEPPGFPVGVFQHRGEYLDPNRQLLGPSQEAWLANQLLSSSARWKLLGQQVMFGHLKVVGAPEATGLSQYLNPDQWDGYPIARKRIFDILSGAAGTAKINNAVILTGDIHTSWAMDITEDPNNPAVYNPLTGDGSLAVEFVTPSITSPGLPDFAVFSNVLPAENPHMKYIDLAAHGYVLLDITPQRIQSEWWYVDNILAPSKNERFARAFASADGANRVKSVAAPSEPRPNPPALAP